MEADSKPNDFKRIQQTLEREFIRSQCIPVLRSRGVPRMLERIINVINDAETMRLAMDGSTDEPS